LERQTLCLERRTFCFTGDGDRSSATMRRFSLQSLWRMPLDVRSQLRYVVRKEQSC
jgi:hypothetical protein